MVFIIQRSRAPITSPTIPGSSGRRHIGLTVTLLWSRGKGSMAMAGVRAAAAARVLRPTAACRRAGPRLRARRNILLARDAPAVLRQVCGDRPAGRKPAGVAGRIALRHEEPEGSEKAHDLLLAGLAAPADAMLRRAPETVLVDETWRRVPQIPEHVEIEVLQGRGHDQITPSCQDTAGLRTAQRLAA